MQEKNGGTESVIPHTLDVISLLQTADTTHWDDLNADILKLSISSGADMLKELAALSLADVEAGMPSPESALDDNDIAKLLLEGNLDALIPEVYDATDFGTFEPYPDEETKAEVTDEALFTELGQIELENIIRNSANLVRSLFTGRVSLPEARGFRYWLSTARDKKRLDTFDWQGLARTYEDMGGESAVLSFKELFAITILHQDVQKAVARLEPPRNTPNGEFLKESFYSSKQLSETAETFLFPWKSLLDQTQGLISKMKERKVGSINEFRLACGIWLASQPEAVRGQKEWALMETGNTALNEYVLPEAERQPMRGDPQHIFLKRESFAKHIPAYTFAGLIMSPAETRQILSYFWE